jgi:glycosyltransferase 2 family protein
MSSVEQVKSPSRERRLRGRTAIGWIISLACLALIAAKVDLQGALAALSSFEWPYLVFGLASLTFGYTMRIARWAAMLRATGAPAGIALCAAPFLGSIALNNVLPLRAGDVVRAVVFPSAIGVPRTAAIGSIVMERLVDLLTLLVCLAIGAVALKAHPLPAWLKDGAVFLAVAGMAMLFAAFFCSGPLARVLKAIAGGRSEGSLPRKLLDLAAELLEGFRQMSGWRTLLLVFGLSALAWLGEMGLFLCLMAGFGLGVDPLAALLVMAFVTLSTLVPSSPGYVGPFHLAAFTALVLLGASEETATSFAVLSHLMLWVPTTLAGGISMLVRPDIFRGAMAKQSQAAEPDERTV